MEFSELIERRQSVRRYAEGDVPEAALREMLEAARLAPSGKNMQNWRFVVIKRRDLIDKIAEAVLRRNEEIASGMERRAAGGTGGRGDGGASGESEEARAAAPSKAAPMSPEKFRNFVHNFTLFFTKAPVLIVVMSQTYLPTGYRELEAAGAPDAELKKLAYLASPGMQSLGAAIEHLLLKAVELGYGGCWLTSANYAADLIEDLVVSETDFPSALLKDADAESGGTSAPGGDSPHFEGGWFMAALLAVGVPEGVAKSPARKPLEEIATFV
jgi:nitroreductase